MLRYIPHIISLALLVLAMYASTQADIVAVLEGAMQHTALGGVFFVLALVSAVVLAPVAALPLIPLASVLFGSFLASVYSILGWTVGGIIAFAIARYVGRPVLSRVVTLDTLARYERLVPKEMAFLTLVLLRMVVPVDVLSYAVGFLSAMSFRSYALATLIGVTPFSFIFAYGSSAVAARQYILIGALVALAVTIFAIALLLMRRISKER